MSTRKKLAIATTVVRATTLAQAGMYVNVGSDTGGAGLGEGRKDPRPNIILIVGDDIGYSDIGCFGSEIQTPHLDKLGMQGIRFTQFSNMAKCGPTRSSLLTGLMVPTPRENSRHLTTHPGSQNAIHIAKLLKDAGYYTAMSGKEHYDGWVGKQIRASNTIFDDYFKFWAINPFFERGDGKPFENAFVLNGSEITVEEMIPHRKPFFKTDVVTDYALAFIEKAHKQDKPFFLYLPYHAAHYPIQARPEDIARYRGNYEKQGWNKIRLNRFKKQQELGIIPLNSKLPPMTREWNELSAQQKNHEDLMMSIFSGLISRMDENIGRVIEKIQAMQCADNTLIIFFSDNGSTRVTKSIKLESRIPQPPGSAGGASSYNFLGPGWAEVGNTPYRRFKASSFAGGTRTHAIFYWLGTIQPDICRTPVHVTDIYPTFLELAGVTYPENREDGKTPELDGLSLVPLIHGKSLPRAGQRLLIAGTYFDTFSVRKGDWKLITGDGQSRREGTKYLFNLMDDPCESTNLYQQMPEKVQAMEKAYADWVKSKQSGRGMEVLESGEAKAALKKKLTELEKQEAGRRVVEQKEALERSPIKEVQYHSEHENILVPEGFDKGAVLWTDRSYTVQSFPPALKGADYIQTAMLDRASKENDLISFTLKQACTVYVGLKAGRELPPWLAAWEKTGEVIQTTVPLICYRKSFAVGDRVVLGHSGGATCMYTVVIQPTE